MIAQTLGCRMLIFTGDLAFLYSMIKYCAFIVHSFGKDASIATDLVLDHRTSGPMVPGSKS